MMPETSLFHQVRSVSVTDTFQLHVVFVNGVEKEYDIRLWETRDEFALLFRHPAFIKSVRVELGGYGVSWNDHIDLHCEELWDRGKTVVAND